ncbi:STAS domain-containing protein [Prauserella oleivorans]|uniref:Anti-sigma factor antagonist n=1 Tax=Prauserella oleivorans TaxID=1478153 RepID=A0ABW5WGA7_9PSEU
MTVANVDVRSPDTKTVEISISGEVDLSNAEVVQDDIYGAVANDLIRVRLDLAGLTYIDSAGLRILFTLADRLQLLQTELEIVAPHGSPTRRVIELSGLDTVVAVQP